MTHNERWIRRRNIADHIKSTNCTVDEAAQLFGVSIAIVHGACREHGVTRPSSRTDNHVETLAIVADMFDASRTLSEIAKARNVSRQRVSRLFVDAVKAGIPIPRRTRSPQARAIRAGVTA